MVSIAMATYNGSKYLREQIESLLSQTVQGFEIVICDDCSTDNTMRILKEYADIDSRIKIYANDYNIGFKKNFEKVVSLTNYEYIALCDQDDVWYPNHLEVLLNRMRDGVQIVCGRPEFVDENNHLLPSEFDYLKMWRPPKNDEGVALQILLGDSSYQGASMLIRKAFFNKALPIPDKANYHDSWFAFLSCFTGGMLYISDPPITRYRRHAHSVTKGKIKTCAFRRLLAFTIRKHIYYDRFVFIDELKRRIDGLNVSQLEMVNKSKVVLLQRKTFIGRLIVLPYMIKHFSAIFASDVKHIFS